ncbi:MAG: Hsp20/alpha crystallin family protein [Bacteroidales bacterium]|nr:Hsp20/alpha crystallin family protein [Bacteroidales bacterium]
MLIKRSNYVPAYVNYFDEIFGGNFFNDFFNDEIKSTLPTANVVENENSFQVELAVPGYTKENFSVELNQNVLTVKGELKNEVDEKKPSKQFTRREHYYASFERNFTLPETVKMENIEASYENGLLCITIPKKDKKTEVTKLIEIK